jgi:maltooligosyltrehalose trehalohydrolase
VLVVAEDARNLAIIVRPEDAGGWGLDAVWADDFHHQLRRLLAGDSEGYYADFRGEVADLARILTRGWLYDGQRSTYTGKPRGTDPEGIEPRRFVFYVQNHDQVGNRALGERLHHQVEPAAWRAAVALLLCAPQTPLLFMGQEWAASSPFLYFTDHHPELGRRVTAGRREEFRRFPSFASAAARGHLPDPQAPETFERSRLRWEERELPLHASSLRLHRALLALRRTHPALRDARREGGVATALGEDVLALRREPGAGTPRVLVARLRGSGTVELPPQLLRGPAPADWLPLLGTEDEPHAPDPRPVRLALSGAALRLEFARPGAVLLGPRGSAG